MDALNPVLTYTLTIYELRRQCSEEKNAAIERIESHTTNKLHETRQQRQRSGAEQNTCVESSHISHGIGPLNFEFSVSFTSSVARHLAKTWLDVSQMSGQDRMRNSGRHCALRSAGFGGAWPSKTDGEQTASLTRAEQWRGLKEETEVRWVMEIPLPPAGPSPHEEVELRSVKGRY